MSLINFICLPPSLISYNLSSLDCLSKTFFNLSSRFITWSSYFSFPPVNLQTFIRYAATRITFVLIAHTKFTSFRLMLLTILTLLLTSPFTHSKILLVLIPSVCSIPKNFYISFSSGSIVFILSSRTYNPSPLTIIRSLHISVHDNILQYGDLLVQ